MIVSYPDAIAITGGKQTPLAIPTAVPNRAGRVDDVFLLQLVAGGDDGRAGGRPFWCDFA